MKKLNIDKRLVKILEYIFVIIIFIIGFFLSRSQNFIAGIFLIIAAIACYIYFTLNGERNFLKLNAVFSFAWISTIGLALMQLNAYQHPWETLTWVGVGLAHLAFLIANDLSHRLFPAVEKRFNLKRLKDSRFPSIYGVHNSRLFWITLISAGIGIAFFIANIIIKGYVPIFASAENNAAYVDFYTRLHIFVVASMVSGGLAFYCLRKCELSITKKIICVLIIIIMVFIIPILLVQRGTFIIVALILTAVIYLISKKRRFILLLACIVAMLGVYQLGTSLRSYSDAQLNEIFSPREVTIYGSDDQDDLDEFADEPITLKLTPRVSYLYAYFTVSHDNFNEAVQNKTENTWGMRQLSPFNVIMRIEALQNKLDNAEDYLVRPNLNTHNLITNAYYDFGIIGIVVLMMIWSFAFGIVESFNRKYKGAFSYLVYGVCLSPVALCFFTSWMSYFTTWLLWGTILIMFLFASFTVKKRNVTKTK